MAEAIHTITHALETHLLLDRVKVCVVYICPRSQSRRMPTKLWLARAGHCGTTRGGELGEDRSKQDRRLALSYGQSAQTAKETSAG